MTLLSAAEALQLANAAILRQLSEGVIVTDVVGTIKFVNEAATALHGVKELNVRPNAYSEAYHLYTEDGRPYPSHELPLARAVRGETVKDVRWRIRRPNGTEVLAIGSAQPIHGPNGQRIGAVLTLRDDTARDASERAQRARETTMRQAIKQLTDRAETAEAVSRDTSSEGRRIKAALNDLLRHAEELVTNASANEARHHSQQMQLAGSALKGLIDRLLGSPDSSVPIQSSPARSGVAR